MPQDQVIPTFRAGATAFATKNTEFNTLNSRANVRALNITMPVFMHSDEAKHAQFQSFLKKEGISSFRMADIFKFAFKGSTEDEDLVWCYFR